MNSKNLKKDKNYVRYDEGAVLYSMCKNSFIKLSREANAVYRVGRICLVNTKILDEYLELYRVCQ